MSQTASSSTVAAAPPRPVNVTLRLRRLHGWLGLLIAPSVLFFALTGAVQLFNLHEAHGGYTPPAALVALSAFHKDQALPHAEAGPPDADADHDHDHADDHHHGGADAGPRPSTLALKWVFLAVSLGLAVSTGLGLWMAFQDRRRRALNAVLLAIGVLAPLLLALV